MFRLAKIQAQYRYRFLLALSICLFTHLAQGANQVDWERAVYQINLHLAVDSGMAVNSDFAETLAHYLEQRIDATLYPWWSVETTITSGPFQHQLLTRLEELTQADINEESLLNFDKQMFLVVSQSASGFVIHCREFDRTTQTQGPVLSRQVRQGRMLAEHCFKLLCETFAPLAKIRRIEEDPLHVTLHFKGSSLSNQTNHSLFIRPDDIYLPLRIRMTRSGEIRPGGISTIPWTYLELEDSDAPITLSRVHSANQHPFGVRRRGRVEHLAIAVRQPPATTRVRFFAQHDQPQSLMGYEVFRREPDSEKSQLIGLTDNRGSVEVLPGTANITNLFLRSGNQLLAKVPVVPGMQDSLEIPIADDIARLNAQATLTSLREQLIDLVARRNILIARVRDRIAESSFEEAKQLLDQLDELPGRAQFAKFISTAQKNRRNQSDEPRIQARIDKMFANTRKLLGRFLDTRPISDLQDQLNAAQSGGSQS